MSVERVVQLHVMALSVLGALLLGMGQDGPLLPLLVVFAAVTSVIFTDQLNWFRLHWGVANVALLIAFLSLSDFFDLDTRGQLLAIAKLLTYMQVVQFYQRKSPRLYWHLLLLSLLQVVVAAALNTRFEFGVLLVPYAIVAISTLVFFFAHRELLRAAEGTIGLSWRRRRGRTPAAVAPRTGLSGQQFLDPTPVVTLATTEAASRTLVTRGFLKQIAAFACATLVFTVVLFFAAPRLESSSRRLFHERAKHVVGYSSTVSLHALDEILQSDEAVMRVSFKDSRTNEPYRVFGDVYYRGSVLTDYVDDRGEGRWLQPGLLPPGGDWLTWRLARRSGYHPSRPMGRPLERPPRNTLAVRQEISLEPIEEPVLFSVDPPYLTQETPVEVRLDPLSQRLYRQVTSEAGARAEFRYVLLTTGFRGGLQIDAAPHANRLFSPIDRVLLEQEKSALSKFDAARFPRLQALADGIARETRPQQSDRASLARALRNHFQTSGLYTYSLDFRGIKRRPELDPIEDFVANHRTGHCVYFASALAMMLRSQGIPSRLVVGFKGGEYNTVGGYYQVLQRHAHVWTEAYLEPEDVAAVVPPGSDVSPGGGWLRLEPTLGADRADARQYERGWLGVADDALDYARTVWSDYILGLTAKRQRESIYHPVSEKADPATWSARLKEWVRRRDQLLGQLSAVGRTWWWLLLVGAVAVGLGLWVRASGQWSEVPRLLRPWELWAAPRARPKANGALRLRSQEVAFYRRFEGLLARRGLARPASQTPREFAARLAAQPLLDAGAPPLGPLAEKIVESFYRVRFGHVILEAHEWQSLAETLALLETMLQRNGENT